MKTDEKLALLLIIISVAWLLYLSAQSPPSVEINKLSTSAFEDISVLGTVSAVRHYDNLAIATISSVESVDIVIFDPRLVPKNNSQIKVEGQLREYRNEMEVIAEKIIQIS